VVATGELQHRLQFESPAPENDEYGNTVEGWLPEFIRWARIMPTRGGETVMAERLQGRQPVVVTVRQDFETRRIKADWRAIDARSGEVYAVRSPPADMEMRRAFFDFIAEIGVAA
jgi:SPP1 family predicted phage head-tail adaptor